jgi:carboxymethylenebutenolidase
MWRNAILAIFIPLAIASPGWAEHVKTQEVTFASGSETIGGYLAIPQTAGRHPAILVLHADSGLTDWVMEQTRQLAEHDYVALALDMYRGRVAHEPELAYNLAVSVSPARAFQDMETAIHYLIARPDVDKDKIGSIGWSVGGKWSIMLAVNDPFLAACVCNYGALPANPPEIEKIRAPILGIFGAEDLVISRQEVENFGDAMTSAHKSFEMKMYRGAGHDFEDPSNQLGYREDLAQEAWDFTLAFLDKHLK